MQGQPVDGGDDALAQEADVEAQPGGSEIGLLLLGGEQVDEQRGEARWAERARDGAVARAEAPAAGAVGEDDDAAGARRHGQRALQRDGVGTDVEGCYTPHVSGR
jgi:hypothetical protein